MARFRARGHGQGDCGSACRRRRAARAAFPVGTDAFINEGHLARAIALTPRELDVLYLPMQWIGASSEHLGYPGTLTLSAETIIRAWTEIGESVARTGCRKLIFANSHGGNSPIIDIVARELRIRRGMLAVNASWARFGAPEGLYSEHERKYGVHGGDRETSLILALRPDAVNRAEAKDFESAASRIGRNFTHLSVTPAVRLWLAGQRPQPRGRSGRGRQGDAGQGRGFAASAAAEFINLLRDVAAFDLAQLRPGPLARHD